MDRKIWDVVYEQENITWTEENVVGGQEETDCSLRSGRQVVVMGRKRHVVVLRQEETGCSS